MLELKKLYCWPKAACLNDNQGQNFRSSCAAYSLPLRQKFQRRCRAYLESIKRNIFEVCGASFLWRILRSALACTVILDLAGSHVILPASGLVIRSAYFSSPVTCFVKDSKNGIVYVRTGKNITVLDENLDLIGGTSVKESTQAENDMLRINGSLITLSSDSHSCLTDGFTGSSSVALENITAVNSTFNSSLVYKTNCPKETWRNITYSFPTKNFTFYVILNQNGDTELWHTITADPCSIMFVDNLQCKAPKFAGDFLIFTQATAAVYVERENSSSSSLYISYVLQNKAISVVCEYYLTGGRIFNQSWQQIAASKLFPSPAKELYNMTFDGFEVLLVQQREQIKMIWLPLLNNTVMPQSLLDSSFGRNDSSDSGVVKGQRITATVLNGNRGEIYVSTETMIAIVKLNKCAQYTNCSDCLMSANGPCGWCPAAKRCSFLQTCKIRNSRSADGTWLESISTSEERCRNPQRIVPPTNNPRQLKKDPGTSATASHFFQNDRRVTLSTRTVSLRAQNPLSHSKLGGVESERSTVHIILIALISLLLVLSSLIVVYLVKYLRVRKEVRVIVQRFQGKYPECAGTKSCRRILDILRRKNVLIQYQYQMQSQESEDSEGEKAALSVTVSG